MRVAHVCVDPGIPVGGSKGASIHVQQIVAAFHRRGDEVTVSCTRTGDEVVALGGATVVHVPVGRAAGPDSAAQREKAVAEASRRIADRVNAEGCDLVYERFSLFSVAASRIDAPRVLEVNAPLIDEQAAYRTLVDRAGAEDAARRQFDAATVVACVSEPVADWVRTLAPQARTVVAPNGVDTRRFVPARIEDGPLRAVFVGSLKPWHGLEHAIDAVAATPGVTLSVIGDGPERERLQQRAADLGVAVDWRGSVPHERIPGILADMHVGLAPYGADADGYFSPLKVYEYLAAGLAVVASDTGQLPEIIVDARSGLLVEPGSAAALADALGVLRDDRDQARLLGAAAQEQALEQHDWDSTLAIILDALAEAPR